MAIQDLPLSQRLSTKFIDTHVRFHTSVLELWLIYPLQMLQTYADLAATAIRRDFLKPRIQENDFSEVVKNRDGNITIQNARFKTRVRASAQVRCT
jgi:hypothetical protein